MTLQSQILILPIENNFIRGNSRKDKICLKLFKFFANVCLNFLSWQKTAWSTLYIIEPANNLRLILPVLKPYFVYTLCPKDCGPYNWLTVPANMGGRAFMYAGSVTFVHVHSVLVNRTDGVPRYPDSPVNGNGVHKIWYPDNGESG